jgi:hypothetical protein
MRHRFGEDFYACGLAGVGASWYEAAPGGGCRGGRFENMGEAQEGCWRDYLAAHRSMPPHLAREVSNVVLWDLPVTSLRVLRIGLVALAKHYDRRWIAAHPHDPDENSDGQACNVGEAGLGEPGAR